MPSPLQKVLLLPPMKGLNLYENPFAMDAQFAEELINYMPPTTEFKCRPGIRRIGQTYGAVRGLYSYSVGSATTHGSSWFDQTIVDGERSVLLIKMGQNSGDTMIYSFNPISLEYETIKTIADNQYSKDACFYKHYIFMTSASINLPMYTWSSRTGWTEMTWKIDGKEITNLENLSFYNGYLYANEVNTLDIYFAKESSIDPTGSANWEEAFTIFHPALQGQLSLDGVVRKGGYIVKLLTFTRAGVDTVNAYLVAITNVGEVAVFEGVDPTDPEKWGVKGRFDIPAPLNKNCFCQMEGDWVVGTYNGLISLNRVLFSAQTEITQSLETRIRNVFFNQMFTESVFNQFLALYYYPKERLLFFNVPTQIPIPLSKIKRGYTFTTEQFITLPIDAQGTNSTIMLRLMKFIQTYIYTNWIDYEIFVQFNGSAGDDAQGITFSIKSVVGSYNPALKTIPVTTTVKLSVKVMNSTGHVEETELMTPLVFNCPNIRGVPFEWGEVIPALEWNPSLYKAYSTLKYYGYTFPQDDKKAEWTITDIVPKVKLFFTDDLTTYADELYQTKVLDKVYAIYQVSNPQDPNSPDVRDHLKWQTELLNGSPHGWLNSAPSQWTVKTGYGASAWYYDLVDSNAWETQDSYYSQRYNYLKTIYGSNMTALDPTAEFIKNFDWNSWVDTRQTAYYDYDSTTPYWTIGYRWPYVSLYWVWEVIMYDEDNHKYGFRAKYFVGFNGHEGYKDPGYIYQEASGSRMSFGLYVLYYDYRIPTSYDEDKWRSIGTDTVVNEKHQWMWNWNSMIVMRRLGNGEGFRETKFAFDYSRKAEAQDIESKKIWDFTGGKRLTITSSRTYLDIDTDGYQWAGENPDYTPPKHIDNFKALFSNVFPTMTFTSSSALRTFAAKYGWMLSPFLLETDIDIPSPPPPPPPAPTPPKPELISLDSFYTDYNITFNLGENIPLKNSNVVSDVYNPDIIDYVGISVAFEQEVENIAIYQQGEGSYGTMPYDSFLYALTGAMTLDRKNIYYPIAQGVKEKIHLTPTTKTVYEYVWTYVLTNGTTSHVIKQTLNVECSGMAGLLSGEKGVVVNITLTPTFDGNTTVIREAGGKDYNTLGYFSFYRQTEPTEDNLARFYTNVPFTSNIRLKPVNVVLDQGWTVSEVSGKWDAAGETMFGEYMPSFNALTAADLEDFAKSYGYLFCNWVLTYTPTPELPIPSALNYDKKPTPMKKNEVDPVPAPVYNPIYSIQNTNMNLSNIPLIDGMNIVAPYRSTQYVMDSYYGTWSQWQDVNMIDGITHQNDFYFIVPEDIDTAATSGSFVYNQSSLCKFDFDANGDYPEDVESGSLHPIYTSYKTASSNLNMNQMKQLTRLKIYATGSTFWGLNANNLRITMATDFYDNPTYWYPHQTWQSSVHEILMRSEKYGKWTRESLKSLVKKHKGVETTTDAELLQNVDRNVIKEFMGGLSYAHWKEYKRVYLVESSMIKNVNMGIIAKTGNRIALKVEMELLEHNIVIYGYELYLKVLATL